MEKELYREPARWVKWIIPVSLILIGGFMASVLYVSSSFGESSFTAHIFVISSSERVVILQECPVLSRANEWYVFVEQGEKRRWIYAGCSDSAKRIKKIAWNKKAGIVGIASDSGWQVGYDFAHAIMVDSPDRVRAAFQNTNETIFPYPDKGSLIVKDISPEIAQKGYVWHQKMQRMTSIDYGLSCSHRGILLLILVVSDSTY